MEDVRDWNVTFKVSDNYEGFWGNGDFYLCKNERNSCEGWKNGEMLAILNVWFDYLDVRVSG